MMGAQCACGLPTVPVAIMPDLSIMRACWECDGITWWPRVSGTVRLTDVRPYDQDGEER